MAEDTPRVNLVMKVEIEAPQVNVQLVAELVNYSVDIQKVQVGPTSPFTTINLQVFADNSLQELISEYSLDGEVFQTMTLLSSDNPRPVNGTQTGTEIVLSWDHLSDLSDIPGGFFNRDVTLRFGISEYLHTYSVSEVLHINRSLVVKTEHTPAGYNASGRPVTGLPRDVKG